jgi:hypothetical protein
MFKKGLFLIGICLFYVTAFSQSVKFPAFTDGMERKSASVQFDNDTYYLTDYYYTNGLEIDLILPVFENRKVMQVLHRDDSQILAGLSLSQHLYTPKNIRDTLIQFNDRPFAATLELDYFVDKTNLLNHLQWQTRIRLGIIGPSAGGEAFQRKIHQWIDSPDPNGWEYEIANDLIANIDFMLAYPVFLRKYFKLSAIGAVRAGTLFDDLNAGVNLQAGNNRIVTISKDKKQDRPSGKKLIPYLTSDVSVRLVGYNATLQGGVFSGFNHHVISSKGLTRVILFSNTTLGLLWRGVSLDYTHSFLTKEFDEGISHQYGSFKLTVFF